MFRGFNKFLYVTAGGLVLMMITGMIISIVLQVTPEEIRKLDMVKEWFTFRLGAYCLILLGWPLICKWVTRPTYIESEQSVEEQQILFEKRKNDFDSLKKMRLKVFLLILFFEIVVIQQFGL